MRSSSRPNPIINASIPRSRLKAPTIGIEPPQPARTGSLPHSACNALPARDKAAGAVGGQPILDEVREGFSDFDRIFRSDEPEREFGARLRRKHGFRPFAGIAADDAVEVAGWPRPNHFENAT